MLYKFNMIEDIGGGKTAQIRCKQIYLNAR